MGFGDEREDGGYRPSYARASDIGVEVVDSRDSLGMVIFRAMPDGQIMSDIKGLRVDKLTAARLFIQLGRALKAQYDAEADPGVQATTGSGEPS